MPTPVTFLMEGVLYGTMIAYGVEMAKVSDYQCVLRVEAKGKICFKFLCMALYTKSFYIFQ